MTKKPRKAAAKPSKSARKPTIRAPSPTAHAAAPSGAQPPNFSDIQNLLDTLVPTSDTNIQSAPHKRFWRNPPTDTRDGFVSVDTSMWGQAGPLVTPGHPETSNLFLALAGQAPFDGSAQNQMPDINADFNATLADADQLNMVATWIKNGAPA